MIFLNAEVVCPQQYLPVIAKSERCERIAVDGGIENHSSIKIAIRRQICTTPGETKPQWCASTVNHCTRSHSEIQIQKGIRQRILAGLCVRPVRAVIKKDRSSKTVQKGHLTPSLRLVG